MTTTKHTLLSASVLSALMLTGCGSDVELPAQPTQPPVSEAPAPAPEPTSIAFPTQGARPAAEIIGDSGSIITAESGLSLYLFDNDSAGASVCNGADGDEAGSTTDEESCAGRWPPLLAADGAEAAGAFSLITRDDGTQQWAYAEFPLYTFADDSAQGDINGDGVGGVWHLARPRPVVTTPINGIRTYVGNQTVLTGSDVGGVFTTERRDLDGFSLYYFDNDPIDQAACFDLGDGGCINAWPPVLADTGARPRFPLQVLQLENGLSQWAYRGKPLYFFANDTAPGDTNGDGAGDVWHLATRAPAVFRTREASTWLSATGRVEVLLPDPDNADAFTAVSEDRDQFTLYTFDNDDTGVSNCNGDCAVSWPPYLASEVDQDVGAFTIIERSDGNRQWTWRGQPLYFFGGDDGPLQTNGDGAGGVWHIVTSFETAVAEQDSVLGRTLVADGDATVLNNNTTTPVAEVEARAGFQLYTFDVDVPGQSNCAGGCADTWPPLLATATDSAEAPFSIITREDGYRQWALNDLPLYFYTPDANPGDQTGEGVGDVWWVARPAPIVVRNISGIGSVLTGQGTNLQASQGIPADELQGFTLYTFDNDVADSGESNCTGGCAAVWPPIYAASADQAFGSYGTIERTNDNGDTLWQWTYEGLPLYFYSGDDAPGDANGNSIPNWRVAAP